MPETDPLIHHFEEILADPEARPATKVAAGKELAKLRERQPVLVDPLGQMRSVVEKYAPELRAWRVCRLIPCVTSPFSTW
jgi:hypothetical protein